MLGEEEIEEVAVLVVVKVIRGGLKAFAGKRHIGQRRSGSRTAAEGKIPFRAR
jgi:hypothetical protein